MPNFHAVPARGQVAEVKSPGTVGHREEWGIRDHDRAAHPRVQDIAVDSNNADPLQPLRDTSPVRQADIEQSVSAQTCVHGVKNRIAVLEQQFAADGSHLNVRRKRTLPIVKNKLHWQH